MTSNLVTVARLVTGGAVAMALTGCVVPRAQYDRLVTEHHSANQARVRLESELAKREGEVAELRGTLNDDARTSADSEARIHQLEQALQEAQSRLAGPFGDIEGLSLVANSEGFTILMQDKLLFDSGSTTIKQDGQSALSVVAREIVSNGYDQVRIDGHTDSDPVRMTKEMYPRGNHELAAERALSVFEYLTGKGKVPKDIFSLASYGPNRPLVTGQTADAKAKNRRVEIHVRVPAN